jgi:cbb3-type cytochrome oxidase subunit 3
MEMFLMVLALSLVGVLVSAILFRAATRDTVETAAVLSPLALPDEERFFVLRPTAAANASRARADALVLEIERHVRLERAAAEAFLQFPTVEALHTRTLAPLAR